MRDLTIELDDVARALYIRLSTEKIVDTFEAIPDRVFVDIDSAKKVVGVEILNVTSDGLPTLLHEIETILEDVQKSMGRDLVLA